MDVMTSPNRHIVITRGVFASERSNLVLPNTSTRMYDCKVLLKGKHNNKPYPYKLQWRQQTALESTQLPQPLYATTCSIFSLDEAVTMRLF